VIGAKRTRLIKRPRRQVYLMSTGRGVRIGYGTGRHAARSLGAQSRLLRRLASDPGINLERDLQPVALVLGLLDLSSLRGSLPAIAARSYCAGSTKHASARSVGTPVRSARSPAVKRSAFALTDAGNRSVPRLANSHAVSEP
jgi:hypothetical protein